jgi:parallel beta-helix repeat protein
MTTLPPSSLPPSQPNKTKVRQDMKTRSTTELSPTPLIISLVASLAFALSLFIAPLAIAASPPCGSTITTDTTLDSDMVCSGTAITIGANNITLDGAGHTITGDTSGGGVENYGYNYVTVKNCIVTNFIHGMLLVSCSHNILDSNTVISNVGAGNQGGGGIVCSGGSSNTLTNNTVTLNVAGGIGVINSSANIVSNNTANSNGGAGIDLENSSNNNLTGNTANYGGIALRGSTNNNITNNTANFSGVGIFLYASDNNTLDSNNANSNSASPGYGIWLFDATSNILTSNTVNSNGNDGIFLYFGSNSNTIGSTTPGAGNTISLNGGNGVEVTGSFPSGPVTGNTISGNSIFSNSRLGIDLGGDGVTPNDPCDTDTGNGLQSQNSPVLYSVSSSGGSTIIAGALNSIPNTSFAIEFFSNDTGDPSTFGEGQTFIGSTQVTTSADCNANFAAVFPVTVSTSQVVTMTATDPSGNTSEFSSWVPGPTPTPTATATATPTATATATATPTPTATSTPTPTPTPTPSYSAQIQPPINADGTSVFSVRRGVVPVKFTLTQGGVATCALPPATIALTRTSGGTTGAVDESVYVMAADNGPNFRIDGCQYVYNLSSSTLGPGTYRVDIKINGQVVGSAIFQLN